MCVCLDCVEQDKGNTKREKKTHRTNEKHKSRAKAKQREGKAFTTWRFCFLFAFELMCLFGSGHLLCCSPLSHIKVRPVSLDLMLMLTTMVLVFSHVLSCSASLHTLLCALVLALVPHMFLCFGFV